MSAKKSKIIVIVGPTSSGKSALAVKLAKYFNGEVISADSRQVYKGLNVATGKIIKSEMKGIPHHLLDVANPKKQYTASDYIKDASKVLRYIAKKNKLPIICGGTGFYISALLGEMLLAQVPPNKTLRERLLGREASKLFEMLKKLDPRRANTIDAKNPVRLIRAIEIARGRGEEFRVKGLDKIPEYKILKIGLTLPKEELKRKIHIRLLARIRQGMIAEAKRLHVNGLSYRRMRELGLEYRALAEYLQNKITKKELLEKIEKENWHYAKRQMTWFKRDKKIRWFKPTESKKIEKAIKIFLKN
ncbi:MAG: tRNA (adenosine(37)-N6)-dimethylallyltransferase MiaA [bacterium]|nr:tRNA (adenosine(37)-N6)-dimethylallyltransferase MiaA [bacterium]